MDMDYVYSIYQTTASSLTTVSTQFLIFQVASWQFFYKPMGGGKIVVLLMNHDSKVLREKHAFVTMYLQELISGETSNPPTLSRYNLISP